MEAKIMGTKTERQKFAEYLDSLDFSSGHIYRMVERFPNCYKTDTGDHIVTARDVVCVLGGSDTKVGELGCVTFCVGGSRRRKHCRKIDNDASMFKFSFCPPSAEEAIKAFKNWNGEVDQKLLSYKIIA